MTINPVALQLLHVLFPCGWVVHLTHTLKCRVVALCLSLITFVNSYYLVLYIFYYICECSSEIRSLTPVVSASCCQTPPNFLVQSDLGRYRTPVVVLPPEDISHPNDADSVVDGNLVDMSDTSSVTGDLVDLPHQNGSVSPDVLAER